MFPNLDVIEAPIAEPQSVNDHPTTCMVRPPSGDGSESDGSCDVLPISDLTTRLAPCPIWRFDGCTGKLPERCHFLKGVVSDTSRGRDCFWLGWTCSLEETAHCAKETCEADFSLLGRAFFQMPETGLESPSASAKEPLKGEELPAFEGDGDNAILLLPWSKNVA
mmetsp:Transcript_124917/g.249436  ORF Transcript_124917/g.249436 Transcript_124917/m.249436 type:complete len:165 (-) Transcript_124917:934-1428(-)